MAFVNSTTILPENSSLAHNNGTESSEEEAFNSVTYAIFVPLVWGIVTVVGALGNAVVIFTLIRHGDKNATNYFVINLAISDLAFVVIVVPFTATIFVLPSWIFGDAMCKITTYMIYVSILIMV